jgi:ribosomal peptide maturation radical SAM protein 1
MRDDLMADGGAGIPLRVALVCMPFFGGKSPSIQIGLLSAIAHQQGIACDTFHLSLELAALLTPEVYEPLCGHRGRMTGDWLFSVAAFGDEVDADDEPFLSAFPDEVAAVTGKIGRDAPYLSELRHETLPAFIEQCAASVDWGAYDVVGFTSTFQQNVASLALAQRMKAQHPRVRIVFGGANFEDEMGPEYVRAFTCIDYAVVGEADLAFPALLEALARGEEPEDVAGVVRRCEGEAVCAGQAPPIRELDALPVPDYHEYYERLDRLGLRGRSEYARFVPFESSRGCWWGQKHHCTFCGLNGLGLSYRAKQPRRVLVELAELTRRHRITQFEGVDNILDMKYVEQLFGPIVRDRSDYTFFYEVKANLTREQIRTLHRGGVRIIQPGIESLSSHVLQLMRKGCTMLQNVRLLKWARYYGIAVGWNMIWGFPGETEEDYRQQLQAAHAISHLQPPTGCSRIWLERFSPYYTELRSFPIHDVRPEASYRHVYPAHVRLEKIAYFFDYEMDETLPAGVHAPMLEWHKEWTRRWESDQPDSLVYRRAPDTVLIDDARGPDRHGTYAFHGPLAEMYDFCSETMRTAAQIQEHLRRRYSGTEAAEDDVRWALEEFCQRELMLGEDGRYLSLALPANPNW